MLILARVCADFYDKNRNLLHRITPRDLNLFREVPESIRQDPLFQMLVDDGSIKYPADAAKDRALEQDPYAGTTPDGREIGAASGGYDADFEVNEISAGARGARAGTPAAVRVRNPAVRGTVAPIEVADREKRPKVETEPKVESKPKAETKSKTTAKAPVKKEAKTEEKPADSRPAETK